LDIPQKNLVCQDHGGEKEEQHFWKKIFETRCHVSIYIRVLIFHKQFDTPSWNKAERVALLLGQIQRKLDFALHVQRFLG
jgi:hypothetical protein